MLGCADGTTGSETETCNPIPLSVSLVSTLFCEIAPFLWEEKQACLHLFLEKHTWASSTLWTESLCNPNKAVHLAIQIPAMGHPFPWTILSSQASWLLASLRFLLELFTIELFSFVTAQPNVHAFTFRKGASMSGETCLRDEPLTYACPGNACNWEWFCVLTVKQPHEASPRPALLALKKDSQETWPSTNANSRVRSYSTQLSFQCSWVASCAPKLLCHWPVKKSFLSTGAEWKQREEARKGIYVNAWLHFLLPSGLK